MGIAELGEGRLVDLHIGATCIRQGPQFLHESIDRIGPEAVGVRVGAGQNRLIATPEMQGAGAGNGDLGSQFRS